MFLNAKYFVLLLGLLNLSSLVGIKVLFDKGEIIILRRRLDLLILPTKTKGDTKLVSCGLAVFLYPGPKLVQPRQLSLSLPIPLFSTMRGILPLDQSYLQIFQLHSVHRQTHN